MVGDVAHRIHAQRQRKFEALGEIVGDGEALAERFRLRVTDILVNVALLLPFVLRMRFADVDGEKIGAVFVIVVELDEVNYLAAERRSGVAAEDEDERAMADVVADAEGGLAIERVESRVGRAIANLQIAAMPLRERVAQEAVDVARASHEMHQHAEGTGEEEDEGEERPFPPVHFDSRKRH
jgi:hypothetical protein